jgi:phosphoglycerol transferase MdoB-like AlkP superfamily enzyme
MYFLEAVVEIGKDIVSRHYIELNETDLRKISDFMADIPEIPGTPDFSANKDKNVVIILVESFNSDVIFQKINGNEITPVMNALVNAENTVSALNIVPQVKEGCSNDGQLLTNTGLLPLDKGVSSMLFGDRNIYPSLPRILARKKPTVIFGDNGATWNQTGAYEGYGFEEILNIHDYEKAAEEKGRDAAMMDLGIEIISRLEEPFLLELVTFSMHVPFKEKAVPTEEWLKTDSLEENERNYYNITHYFDRSLGDFINKLKSMNKYDDTVIFIVSDHSQGIAKNKKVFKDGDNNRQDFLPMAFIALNTGHTQKVDAPAGQVNVFPTILHILNRNNEPYHGIDRSLLDPQLSSSVTQQGKTKGNATLSEISRQKRAYDIADSIQRGDYFRQIEKTKKK